MATIIPLDMTDFLTNGERLFYHFLRSAVKPDTECFAWYSPTIEGREPDFILYTPDIGLIVFEVKDWVLPQIVSADSKHFTLELENTKKEKRTHPLEQAKMYMFAIINRIKKSCAQLVSTHPSYIGKPRLPVHSAVVFANITRDEFVNSGLVKILSPEKVFFADDINPNSLLLTNDAGDAVHKRLQSMFPPLFSFHLTSSDIGALRDVLWPEVCISLPKRTGTKQISDNLMMVRRLDAQQESLVRRLDTPFAVFEGPAGCGKTLILIHKALQSYKRLTENGTPAPVLIICFNLTLVHYLKRLLAEHHAPMGRDAIHVMHFYSFCHSLIDIPLQYEANDTSYYDLVIQMATEGSVNKQKYGAIFVDEGQDFSDNMLQVLRNVLLDFGTLWIAMDTAQSLYTQKQAWLHDPKFTHFSLKYPYRATSALSRFCETLLRDTTSCELASSDSLDALHSAFTVLQTEGEAPRCMQVTDAAAAAHAICLRIQELHTSGIPYSEMMVLCASRKHHSASEQDFPQFLQEYFESRGILSSWMAKDVQSKTSWDITTDKITISTVHSVKGLDAEVVFIWGLDLLEESNMPLDRLQSIAYVACSRARSYLDIVYCKQTSIISTMIHAI